jgi:hypothetical protein
VDIALSSRYSSPSPSPRDAAGRRPHSPPPIIPQGISRRGWRRPERSGSWGINPGGDVLPPRKVEDECRIRTRCQETYLRQRRRELPSRVQRRHIKCDDERRSSARLAGSLALPPSCIIDPDRTNILHQIYSRGSYV